MSVGVANRTLAQVVKETLRLAGAIRNEGTATAGTTTTLTDANDERTPTAQSARITGNYIYTTGGTANTVGNAREVTTYSTLGVYTWIQAVANAPATDTTWILSRIRPQRAIDAIDEVTRLAWRKQAIAQFSESLVTNNLLMFYGDMEEWTNGASSAPDGFALSGAGATVARQATLDNNVAHGLYAADLTAGAGAVGILSRDIPVELKRVVVGKSLYLLGALNEAAASDGVVRITTQNSAGTSTNTDITGLRASSRMEELSDISTASISTPDPLLRLTIQLRAAAGTTVGFDDIVLHGPDLFDYDLPAILIGLDQVIEMESFYKSHQFTLPLYYGADWDVHSRDSTATTARVLHFNHSLPSARHLRLRGYRAPLVQATATSNVEPNPVWLAHAAAVRLLEQEEMNQDNLQRLNYLRERLTQLEGTTEGNTTLGKSVAWIEGR